MSTDILTVKHVLAKLIADENGLYEEGVKVEEHIKTIKYLQKVIQTQTQDNMSLISLIINFYNYELTNRYILYSKLRESLIYTIYNNYDILIYHLKIIFTNAYPDFTFTDLIGLIFIYQTLRYNNSMSDELINKNPFLRTFDDKFLFDKLYNNFFEERQINQHIVEKEFIKYKIIHIPESSDLVYKSIEAIIDLSIDFNSILQSDKEYI